MPLFSAVLRSILIEQPAGKDARASEILKILSNFHNGATTPYHWHFNFRCKNSRPHFGNPPSLLFPGATSRTFSVSFPGTLLKIPEGRTLSKICIWSYAYWICLRNDTEIQ